MTTSNCRLLGNDLTQTQRELTYASHVSQKKYQTIMNCENEKRLKCISHMFEFSLILWVSMKSNHSNSTLIRILENLFPMLIPHVKVSTEHYFILFPFLCPIRINTIGFICYDDQIYLSVAAWNQEPMTESCGTTQILFQQITRLLSDRNEDSICCVLSMIFVRTFESDRYPCSRWPTSSVMDTWKIRHVSNIELVME